MSKQRTLTLRDRRVLAERWAAGDGAVNIAVELGLSLIHIYDHDLAEYIENKIINDHYSPAAALASLTLR